MTNETGATDPGPTPTAQPLDSTMNFAPGMTEIHEAAQAVPQGLSVDDVSSIEALPAGTALLIVQRGPNIGARFLLDDSSVTVGRDPGSSIFLDDVTVSRRHAEFLFDQAAFHVRDFGSLNGTYVNRQRVDSAVLTAGDEVQVGKYRMTFHPSRRVAPQEAAAAPENP